MGTTGFEIFDDTVQKSNLLLKDIEDELGWQTERNLAYQALRVVLHTLRDRLPVDEATDLAAQLPMLIRGLYYEGWDPSNVPIKMNREEFIQTIREKFPYDMNRSVADLARTVIQALKRFVTRGELDNVLSVLPKGLAATIRI